jgi:ribokinase
MPPPTIAVIGSLNIDFVTLTPRVPSGGETLTSTSMTVHPGGKGANQAVACGKASFTSKTSQDIAVRMIGSVGANDPYYASLLKPTLTSAGVSTEGIVELSDTQTGTATILVEESTGQNRILFVPGANYAGLGKDAEASVGKACVAGKEPEVLVMQGEIPRDTTFGVLERLGRGKGTQVVLNPAPVYTEGIPAEVLRNVDYLVVNETECLLLGRGVPGIDVAVQNEEDMSQEELKRIAAGFHDKAGVRNLLVTLGAKGVFYSSAESKQDLVPGLKVPKVVDTTAAGDTFVGYFAAALARYVANKRSSEAFDIGAATKRANQAAALCVQRSGAMQSVPFGYEVE